MKLISSLVFTGALASAVAAFADPIDFSKLDLSKLPPASTQKGVTFEKDIKPLFEASCTGCHGAQGFHFGRPAPAAAATQALTGDAVETSIS